MIICKDINCNFCNGCEELSLLCFVMLMLFCILAEVSNMTTMIMTTTMGPEFENVDRVLTKVDGINVLGKCFLF